MNMLTQIVIAQQAADNSGIDTVSSPTFLVAQNISSSSSTTITRSSTTTTTAQTSSTASKSSSALPYTSGVIDSNPSGIIIVALIGFIAIMILMLFADSTKKKSFERSFR